MKINKQWLKDHGLTQKDIDEFRHPGPEIMGGQQDPEGDFGPGGGGRVPERRFNLEQEEARSRSLFTGISEDVRDKIMQLLSTVGQQNRFFFGGADDLFGRSQGTQLDPQMAAFRDRRLGTIRGQNSEFFGRRGTEGSSAELNALNRATGDFESEFGVQQLARRDEQFNQSFALRTAGLENEQLGPATLIQLLAQINANQA